MSSPSTALTIPTIDPSLLELDGRTFKDLSRQAAAQRAAYTRAKAAQFLASSPAEQAAMPGLGNRFANFTNNGSSPDWTPDYGIQGPGGEGWILHSKGNASSRFVFNYNIADGSSPGYMVRVWVRGAPDNGKNSYVSLIEQYCADHPSAQNAYCDEIDIVEYYGQTSHQRSEFTVHKNGQPGAANWFVWPTPGPSSSPQAPGHAQTSYSIYLEPGTYLDAGLEAPDGHTVYDWSIHNTDPGAPYIPSRLMKLYVGIWDIGLAPNSLNVDIPPGSFPGDSWMALSMAQVWTPS